MLEKIIRISTFDGYSTKSAKEFTDKNRTPPIYPPRHTEHVSLCNAKFKNSTQQESHEKDMMPTIYFITPTYPRSEQIAELTRLAQTLLHIKNLHWIIAEDSPRCSKMVGSLLERFNIPYTHLTSPMPDIYRSLAMKDRPRGVSSRRAGLQWVLNHNQNILNQTIENHTQKSANGGVTKKPLPPSSVVYFGDDDNT